MDRRSSRHLDTHVIETFSLCPHAMACDLMQLDSPRLAGASLDHCSTIQPSVELASAHAAHEVETHTISMLRSLRVQRQRQPARTYNSGIACRVLQHSQVSS